MQHCKTLLADFLLACAGLVFTAAAGLALLDGMVSGRAFAAVAVGLAVATIALAVNSRRIAGGLAVTVERAPLAQFWRGYEARGEDDGGSPNDLDA